MVAILKEQVFQRLYNWGDLGYGFIHYLRKTPLTTPFPNVEYLYGTGAGVDFWDYILDSKATNIYWKNIRELPKIDGYK